MPFDVAFSLAPHEVAAWCIAFGEMDGNEYDFASNSWKDKP